MHLYQREANIMQDFLRPSWVHWQGYLCHSLITTHFIKSSYNCNTCFKYKEVHSTKGPLTPAWYRRASYGILGVFLGIARFNWLDISSTCMKWLTHGQIYTRSNSPLQWLPGWRTLFWWGCSASIWQYLWDPIRGPKESSTMADIHSQKQWQK